MRIFSNRFQKVVILSALFCAGCGSEITVTHVDADTSSEPMTGVPWTLPMTQYSVVITREVTSCDGGLSGKVTVSLTSGKAPDPDQHYLLDSSGIWATSDIATNLASDGSNSSLNASSQGAGGIIITSVAQFAAGAVEAVGAAVPVGGPPIVDGGANPPPPPPSPASTQCGPAVKAAIEKLHPPKPKSSLQQQVTDDQKALTAATATVTLLTAQASREKKYLAELDAALREQEKAQKTMDSDQASFTANRKKVSYSETVSWPPSGGIFESKMPSKLSGCVFQQWTSSKDGSECTSEQLPEDTKSDSFNVWFALYCKNTDGSWSKPGPGAQPKSCGAVFATPVVANGHVGVPVRIPKMGRLLVCTKTACPPELPVGWMPPKGQTASADAPVLQLGQMYNVRAAGGAFKNEAAAIVLDASGSPQSIEVSEKTAAAAAAVGAAASAAQAAAAVPGAVASAHLTEAQALSAQITAQTAQTNFNATSSTAYETDQIQAATGLQSAKNLLATAKANAVAAGPSAALAAQVGLLNQQNQLAALEAGAKNVSTEDALSAETTLYNDQTAEVNAEVSATAARALLSGK